MSQHPNPRWADTIVTGFFALLGGASDGFAALAAGISRMSINDALSAFSCIVASAVGLRTLYLSFRKQRRMNAERDTKAGDLQ
jgi:hypothetical protein